MLFFRDFRGDFFWGRGHGYIRPYNSVKSSTSSCFTSKFLKEVRDTFISLCPLLAVDWAESLFVLSWLLINLCQLIKEYLNNQWIRNTCKFMMNFINKWYPVIIAFIALMYSVGVGLTGDTEAAQYSAHWPGTILLFAIAIRQRRLTNPKKYYRWVLKCLRWALYCLRSISI